MEAVNDMTGEKATSPAVYLSVSGEEDLLGVFLLSSLAHRRLNELAEMIREPRRREEEMQGHWWRDETSRLKES